MERNGICWLAKVTSLTDDQIENDHEEEYSKTSWRTKSWESDTDADADADADADDDADADADDDAGADDEYD